MEYYLKINSQNGVVGYKNTYLGANRAYFKMKMAKHDCASNQGDHCPTHFGKISVFGPLCRNKRVERIILHNIITVNPFLEAR